MLLEFKRGGSISTERSSNKRKGLGVQNRRVNNKTEVNKANNRKYRYTFKRHKIVYTLLRPFFRLFLRLKYNYRAESFCPPDMKSPYFILASHTGALDPFMLAMSFKEPIYFVASDHIFRLGLISKIINWLVAPIPIVKSQIDLQAMRQIVSISREGGIVCLFPSGNRSFTGSELPIPDATGKLIRHMKCNILFYRFEGGYLSSPRWARHSRRGQLSGRVVRSLTAHETAAMTPEELNNLAAELLQTDPYQNSRPGPINYRGRKLAEYLERVLFVCPSCQGITTLKSSGCRLSCSCCDFSADYLENGWFKGLNNNSQKIISRLPHTAAFDSFQREWLEDLLMNPARRSHYYFDPIFFDLEENLIRTSRAEHNELIITGSLRLFRDRMELEDTDERKIVFAICDLGRLSVHGPQVFQFYDSKSDVVYELKSARPRSAYKYLIAIDLLKRHCSEIKEEVI